MSLKSFHIIFILISSLFAIFLAYWNYKNWIIYNDNIHLVYSLIGVILCICLFIYCKLFLNKISKINVS